MCVCVSERESVCVCVCVWVRERDREKESVCVGGNGMNLKYALSWHIHIPVYSVLCQCYTQAHTHTRILKPFEDSEPTGLKVDIARGFTEEHQRAKKKNNHAKQASLTHSMVLKGLNRMLKTRMTSPEEPRVCLTKDSSTELGRTSRISSVPQNSSYWNSSAVCRAESQPKIGI